MQEPSRSTRVRRLQPQLLIVLTSITVVIIAFIAALETIANEHLSAFRQHHALEIQQIDDAIAMSNNRTAAMRVALADQAAKDTAYEVITNPTAAYTTIDSSTCNISKMHDDPASTLVLVNKKHCLQPLTYAPDELVTVYGALLTSDAAKAFAQLYEAARAAGQPITVTSSYRSFQDQVVTYQYWVGVSGYDGADTYSARPGYSEHQTGLAVDLASPDGCVLSCFGATSQYTWLQANAATYGFIQRYHSGDEATTGYSAEEWHYRYVGREVALDMKDKGIDTLEEYWNLPGGYY
ncbi:D-alanyl-D-alanine carboxypeptidase [Candidatus Saccharibacteria bacterium]|nr:D-alanyl-D-alanine carboxypeptidase [Candidatus Saccharibacteria bacterium]